MEESDNKKIEPLYNGNKHADTLLDVLWQALLNRAIGVSIPEILGVLDLLKDKVKESAEG